LLAYLACHPDRPHPRDVLIELLWPESDPDVARHNLRESLSSLRHQLELPGTLRGTVLVADHAFVRLNGEAVSTDLSAFEEALASPSVTSPQSRKMGIHGPVGV
jgi:DNA-binding SARP family transcriptional activator